MMKRSLIAVLAFFCATTFSFGQEQTAEANPIVLPMFGNKAKTEEQQKKDERFLSSCDKSFASRQEASSFFVERGWEYLNEGQTDTAMYRFNLAWLLNPDNKDTYWAFGLITSAKGQNDQAIDLYEKALAYDPKNSVLLSDLSSSYLTMYKEKSKRKTLKKASRYINQALVADSTNAYALYNLSKVKFFEKKYDDAWSYLHKSRQYNMTHIDYTYIMELVAQKPDPTDFFKSSAE